MSWHHRISPSAADRWMACPGSPNLLDTVPRRPSGPAALEGTRAHAIRERMLTGQVITIMNDGEEAYAMSLLLKRGVNYLLGLGGQRLIEHRFSLDPWIPGGSGTSDAVVHRGAATLVNDLKYGVQPVQAKDNKQLMIYALGAMRPGTRTVTLQIDAPRAVSSQHSISREDLLDFGSTVARAAIATESKDAPRIAGDKQCQWCDARTVCPEYATTIMTGFDS